MRVSFLYGLKGCLNVINLSTACTKIMKMKDRMSGDIRLMYLGFSSVCSLGSTKLTVL